MTKWRIPIVIISSLIIGFNVPILSTILAIILFVASTFILTVVTLGKYLSSNYLTELENLIQAHYNKYTLLTAAIIIAGLILGSFYLTTILYILAVLVIYVIAENHG